MRNIARMMAHGDQDADKRRQASPFLNYALDKYNINMELENVPSMHEGEGDFSSSSG